MIKLENLSKSIKGDIIFQGINYTFEEGNTYVITGKSGSGKSSLLNVISMLDKDYKGNIKYINFEKTRKNIGYMFQNYGLIGNMSVIDNVKIVCKDSALIESTLKKYQMLNKSSQKVNSLSGGEAQRIAFIKLYLKNPKLIICDEPTGNLDNENRDFIINELLSLKKKDNIIICVTHDEELLSKFDHRIKLI